MNQPTYFLETSEDALTFEFESVSLNRTVTKIVIYSPLLSLPGFYNLGFGDLNEDGELSDEVVTNNGDMSKVLATVVSTLFVFLEANPTATVFFKGSTPFRTKLYQRIIQSNLVDISSMLIVSGIKHNAEETFNERIQYDSFLVRKR